MNLIQLETFLAVARTQSFTHAAPAVHLTQSAVSRQIQELEKSLGVQLFERLTGRVSLTTAGRALMEEVPRLLRQVQNVRLRLADISEGEAGEIRIGASVSAANTFLPQVLARFRQLNPSVTLSLLPGRTGPLIEKIRNNEVDVAVIGSEVSESDLETCYRVRDELVLVASPTHPLVRKSTVPVAQLTGVEFIFREPGSDSRALVEKWLGEHGVEVRKLMDLW